jgi:epoxyqueuosine reductase QueG
LADYADILQARKAHYDFWIREPHGLLQGAQPNTLMPSAKSVLVLVWDYLPKP